MYSFNPFFQAMRVVFGFLCSITIRRPRFSKRVSNVCLFVFYLAFFKTCHKHFKMLLPVGVFTKRKKKFPDPQNKQIDNHFHIKPHLPFRPASPPTSLKSFRTSAGTHPRALLPRSLPTSKSQGRPPPVPEAPHCAISLTHTHTHTLVSPPWRR